jgi:hypothetical protein
MLDRAGRPAVRPGAAVLVVALTMLVAGCSHLSGIRWPWRHKPTPPPPEVHELDITAEGGTAANFPQYWKRNTLLVDLRTASGSGGILLKPRQGTAWPVRLALRVMPGSVGVLEVRGDQRTLLPITPDGTKPIDLELVPGIYTPKTTQIAVSWGPNTTAAAQ